MSDNMLTWIILSVAMCLNGTAYNISTLQALGQYENSALASCQGAPPYALGYAAFLLAFITLFGIMALRYDPTIAGAIASFFCIGIVLLLQQLGWTGENAIGIPFAMSVIFLALALLKGALRPY